MSDREPWFSPAHAPDCASRERLPDPGPEGEGAFDERGWYHPPCDCSVAVGPKASGDA